MRILFIIFLLIPLTVFSQENTDMNIAVDSDDFSNLIFEVPQGSAHNAGINVKNISDQLQEIKISINIANDDQVQGSLVTKTRFFDDTLDEESQNLIENNDNNVKAFCDKNNVNELQKKWCEGLDEIIITLDVGESKRVPMIVQFVQQEQDHEAYLSIEQKKENAEYVLAEQKEMVYRMPGKEVAVVDIVNFGLVKLFGPFDISAWFSAGMKEEYEARYVMENVGAVDTDYTYYANVHSMWIDENVYFEGQDHIKKGEKKENLLTLSMPRFGRVSVVGGLKYTDENGMMQEMMSNPIELMVWPATLLIILFFGICFCVVSVLLYTYIRKNMFGRKKKKKEKNIFTGTYTVRDADNIISIAQRYDVPWKDLAKHNGIEPPYILISGEAIHVPGGASDEEEQLSQEGIKKSVVDAAQEQIAQTLPEKSHVTNGPSIDNMDMQKDQSVQSVPESMSKKQQGADVSEKIEAVHEEELASKKKKRKVTFASPKNMLTKPSSEPTTRAIDIEWMRDDEVAYMEEMEVQEKKTSRRFIIVITIMILVAVAVLWWGITKLMQGNDNDNVSVESLIEESMTESKEEVTQVEEILPEEDVQPENEGGGDEIVDGDDKTNIVSTEGIVVQVLNAGAQVGAAGDVSTAFETAGYTVNAAQNAQNDYEGVVVYYDSDHKDIAEKSDSVIDEKYGEQKMEESNDVTKKYDANIVIVLGS